MFNYLIHFVCGGQPISACIKENNPDDALFKLSQELYKHGAPDPRVITLQSVTQDYLFDNQGVIQIWI